MAGTGARPLLQGLGLAGDELDDLGGPVRLLQGLAPPRGQTRHPRMFLAGIPLLCNIFERLFFKIKKQKLTNQN